MADFKSTVTEDEQKAKAALTSLNAEAGKASAWVSAHPVTVLWIIAILAATDLYLAVKAL
jgi:hypothetical protein